MSTTEWRNDDAGYLTWVTSHPDNFIANIRSRDKRQFKVHKASCKLPDRSKPETINPWTGNQYAKVSGDSVAQLKEWARENGYAAAFDRCRNCNPAD